ncbi:MAG: Release factor glutamine methyltransferase [Bacteroidia bacterium]|nr:Release factor glutamine methyltransferase [Bacteroidia bacterium]MCE7955508.1 peptide chain release factor N(5)-glutamine methyltransferase [Bacteroidetes bacterium CHB6]
MHSKDLLNRIATELSTVYDREESMAIARYVSDYMAESKMLNPDAEVEQTEETWLEEVLSRLKKSEPVQYVLGFAYFIGNRYVVNKDVLIPRPETEELLELVYKKSERGSFTAIDIGTGSGCIAVELSKKYPKARVYAVDVSERALAVASENSKNQNVQINFVSDDILHPAMEKYPTFDLIVSNPPYIASEEKEFMHANVLNFEPHLALFASNPLEFYEAIVRFAEKKLKSDGKIFLEINPVYAESTLEIYQRTGFSDIELVKDITGKQRFLFCRKL